MINKKDRNIIKLKYPASCLGAMWRDALPTGNGEIGAAVYGGVYQETIMLTHTDLWWKGITTQMPDVSDKLTEVRTLLIENKPIEADTILADALKQRGYNPKIASPLPLGDLKVIMHQKNAFKDYSRSVNMETGEINVSWMDGTTRYSRNLFASRTDSLLVYKIDKYGNQGIDVDIFIDLHDRNDAKRHTDNIEKYLPQNVVTKVQDGIIFYAAQNEDGSDFGAVARIICDNGSVEHFDSKIRLVETDSVLVIIKLFVNDKRQLAWSRLEKEIMGINDTYESLLKVHIKEHMRLFNSMSLNLFAQDCERFNEELLMESYSGNTPAALVEKMWSYGRYLLISSSKVGGNPCHLYGLWCGEYQGMWAFNMANENIQMIYWHALSGNMPELLLALFDYYERMMKDFRENAKKLYGCRGIYIPAPTSPDSGLLKHVMPHIIHWTGASGWLSQHYYDYYLYTGDIEFLKNRALPFMKEAALFYEDFFTVGDDGLYLSYPSNSPENTPGNYWDGCGMGATNETTINATMDFAIAKELLTNLAEGSKVAGVYKDEINKWETMLSRIPSYQINEDGAIKEWMHPYFTDNYHHRHQSHIYPVFPGTEVTKSNNPELFKAFVTAVKKRLVIGLKEQTGWSLAHMANNYARMGEGDLALECLEIMSRSCVLNNFYTTHNDWRSMGIGVELLRAPVQLDANMGWSAAVNEMLLFSVPGSISILPALPSKWEKGKVQGLMAKGGIEVSINWDIRQGSVEVFLQSKISDCLIDIVLPSYIINVKDYKITDGMIKNCELKLGKEVKVVLDLKTEQQNY